MAQGSLSRFIVGCRSAALIAMILTVAGCADAPATSTVSAINSAYGTGFMVPGAPVLGR